MGHALRHPGQNREPVICLALGHEPGLIQAIEKPVCLIAQPPERRIGQCADRLLRYLIGPHIGITGRVAGADKKHRTLCVFLIDPVGSAVNHRTAAIGTVHASAPGTLLLLHFFVFHFSLRKRKSRRGAKANRAIRPGRNPVDDSVSVIVPLRL